LADFEGRADFDARFERKHESGCRRLRRAFLRGQAHSDAQHGGHNQAHRERHADHEAISR
jgi:hypothetical protein